MNSYAAFPRSAAQADVTERAAFITRTYLHLAGAMFLFVFIEVFLFESGLAEPMALAMINTSWLFVLGAFMIVGWFASRTAHMSLSKPMQYAALAGFVAAQAVIFVPMLWMANQIAPGAIQSAALVTLIGFTGLTVVVFTTRRDFSFLGGLLRWGFVLALVAIVAGVLFGFQLGTWFSLAMVALAGGAILYDTSNVLHHYPTDRYVAASLELFASVALLFWYVLQLFISRD